MTPARAPTAALPRAGAYPAGLMGVLATVTMLFAAFTAALLVRRAGHDWVPIELPRLVWVNAAVILASSVMIEMGRQTLVRPLALTRVATGLVLGVLFLAGQVLAWRALAARGVFLPTSPHAAFFYLLSGVHGVHVLGGLGALGWAVRGLMRVPRLPLARAVLTHVTVFWHFVGALWLYLLILLTLL